ncbi:MAG: peptidylprolyl isomerase [Phenylobacterium sp.]
MIRRREFIGAAAATAAGPGLAPSTLGGVRVRLSTRLGDILLELRRDRAPATTANFLRYVDERRMDKGTFYRRSVPPGTETFDYGVVQGGLQNNPAWVLPPVRHEPTSQTGLRHTDGAISMGRRAPGSATSDFFICVGEQAYLDADPAAKGDNLGFACFGYVIDGMDTVRRILAQPVSPTAGVGAMKGEMLRNPLTLTARRV